MITNFENLTEDLTENDKDNINLILLGLKHKIGIESIISNKQIRSKLLERGIKISDIKIRKIIHYIRLFHLPDLIANSKGYYRATSIYELEKYADSLTERIEAIETVLKTVTSTIQIKKINK